MSKKSTKSANAVAVTRKMVRNHKAPKLTSKAPSSRRKAPAVVIVTEELKASKTLPPPAKKTAADKRSDRAAKALAKDRAELFALAHARENPRKTVAGLVEAYLAGAAKESSEAYVKSISRPLAAFVTWCERKGLTPKTLDTAALERYRKHVVGLDRALSTTRMELARVQTCLRVMGVDADLSTLRIQHTKAEKKARAEAAQ